MQSQVVRRILASVLLLTPPAVLAALILEYSVNVPYWDEWDSGVAGLFEKYAAGQLSLGDLFAQQNEVRLFFPRLLVLVLGELTGWDVRYEMAAGFVLVCLTAFMTYRLAAPGYAGSPSARFAVMLLASLLFFSPVSHEAWLWGLELIRYVPLACITGGLLIARQPASTTMKLLGCAALSVVSTFSFSNGFLCWIVLAPALYHHDRSKGIRRARWGMVLCSTGLVLCMALYFHGYQHPPHYRPLSELWLSCVEHPSRAARYFFCFLGAPLAATAANPLNLGILLGAGSFVLFAAAWLSVVALRDNRKLKDQTGPWVAIGNYAILSALLATSSRAAQFGPEQALSPRYSIFGITFLVATIHLLPLVTFEALGRVRPSRTITRLVNVVLAGLAAGVCAVHLWAFPAYVYGMRAERGDRLLAKSCLAFINVLPQQPAVADVLYPDYQHLKSMAASLTRQSLLHPPPFTQYPSHLFRYPTQEPDSTLGYLERCGRVGTNELVLAGWALSPSRRREADAVLLTYEREDGEARLFGLARARVLRNDLGLLYGDDPYYYSGWERICALSDLPREVLVLRAWSYDSEQQTAHLLGGNGSLDNR